MCHRHKILSERLSARLGTCEQQPGPPPRSSFGLAGAGVHRMDQAFEP